MRLATLLLPLTVLPSARFNAPPVFAGQAASAAELSVIATVEGALRESCEAEQEGSGVSSAWLRERTRTDLLRYTRAVAAGRPVQPAMATEVEERLLSTARWREAEGIDAVAADERYGLESFFEGREAVEAVWLPGRDPAGRVVACFFADRHTPGSIPTEEWRRCVIHNGELCVREKGIAEGPNGQLTLIVDRTSSGRANQDVGLALALLPELLAHYPDLLHSVVIAPVNGLFWSVWRVVRLFLSERTAAKFVLLRSRGRRGGADWRRELRERVGTDVELPEHLRPSDEASEAS